MFIELNRGQSFRGIARYCLHDLEGETSDRVEFVETRNLATGDAETAWRIMAARSYVQDELKARNGIGPQGRKGKPVGHLLLSWGREEAEAQKLDRAGMVQAAEGAMKAIGAEDRQAIIIAHNDTSDRNPHCHVIINLIGDDGRLLKSYNDHKKLSRYALDEEIRIHGEAVVKLRRQRWADREAGETPPPVKKKPRHLFEMDRAVEADEAHAAAVQRLRERQQQLERRKAAQSERQARNAERLKELAVERERRIMAEHEALVRRARSNARNIYRECWSELHEEQEKERLEFRRKESTKLGSIENALRMVDWFKLFERPRDAGREGLKDLFSTITSEAFRWELLAKRHEAERHAMREEQLQAERGAEELAKEIRQERVLQARRGYVRKAEAMKQRHRRHRDALRTEQQGVTAERNQLLREYREQTQLQKRRQVEILRSEREYISELKQSFDSVQEGDGGGQQGGGDAAALARRGRRPRDVSLSRRKRQQRGETPEQYQERLSRVFDAAKEAEVDHGR